MKIIKSLLLSIFLLYVSGCATGMSFEFGRHESFDGIYIATRIDNDSIKRLWEERMEKNQYSIFLISTPFIILDYPFSIVFDTLLLPYDLFELRK